MSYSTEVSCLDYELQKFVVKNVYSDQPWKLCWRHGISTEVFCQYKLRTWHGQVSPDICYGIKFYNKI